MGGLNAIEIRIGIYQGCIFINKIGWIIGQALPENPEVQVEATAHVANLAFADDIVTVM